MSNSAATRVPKWEPGLTKGTWYPGHPGTKFANLKVIFHKMEPTYYIFLKIKKELNILVTKSSKKLIIVRLLLSLLHLSGLGTTLFYFYLYFWTNICIIRALIELRKIKYASLITRVTPGDPI